MKLAIFDIDGTLTDTNGVDDECFVAALSSAHDLTDIDTNWAAYPHTTDSGIALKIFQDRFGRAPESDELFKFQQRFISLLEERCDSDSTLFAEIKGAADAFKLLRREGDWAVAIATGCWRESALLKLRAAGIEFDKIPAAFAEDGIAREEILRQVIGKSLDHYGQDEFEKIVSIGDGLWDVRAAARLRLSFLGIGVGERVKILQQAGAKHVLEDYTDYQRLLYVLLEAEIPALVE